LEWQPDGSNDVSLLAFQSIEAAVPEPSDLVLLPGALAFYAGDLRVPKSPEPL
jgi:hypothetical protein